MQVELASKVEEKVEEPKEVIKITHDPVVEEKTKPQVEFELQNLQNRRKGLVAQLESVDLEISEQQELLSLFTK